MRRGGQSPRWRSGIAEGDRSALAMLAPGTMLRDALDRILRGQTGALIVLGHDATVESICTGGFTLDVKPSATRLRELAKMDGAIVLDTDRNRIVGAAIHLVPDPRIPTEESGTRHRTAERVARQTGFPVLSVSHSMRTVALYVEDRRYVVEDSTSLLSRANQALSTLERYRSRLDEVSGELSGLELEDLATVRDVAAVVQRLEMVRRISTEIEGYVVELGSDGRLLQLQLDELTRGMDTELDLTLRDYCAIPLVDNPGGAGSSGRPRQALTQLGRLSASQLLELASVAEALGFEGPDGLDQPVSPRGYRLLARVPRLPQPVASRLISHFGDLRKILTSTVDDLQAVDGVGETRARAVRDGLNRLAESFMLERYG
ncbi:DNA integrity scanning diadenylate cyclase DisA [Lipingzhangella sp. LS1_29]|uniref:DNA integrity scanning protein DisA n=1 Tax=Lipingzhangella rawalii TaxID=2055835 RepID=A0ABU2H8U2_9ACTN|nr:DNA integrity scanning diadenylate cyclase DisA [Lipingzhangella rawalii]